MLGLRMRLFPARARYSHEAAVDPVLPPPDPSAFHGPASPGSNGVPVTRADDAQELFLQVDGLQGAAQERSPEILLEGFALSHGKDSCLFPRLAYHACRVARGKNTGMGCGLEGVADPDEAIGIGLQARLPQPWRRPRLRGPQHLVQGGLVAVIADHLPRKHLHHAVPDVNRDPAL